MDKLIQDTEQENTSDGQKGHTRKKTAGSKKRILIIAAAAIFGLCLLSAVYIIYGQKYKYTYFPHTIVNGIDVSGMTVDDVKTLISSGVTGYELTILERENQSETIKGQSFDLHSDFDGTLEAVMDAQNPFRWLLELYHTKEYQIKTMIVYDEASLDQVLSDLLCVSGPDITEPVNAYVSDYITGTGYVIVPAVQGTEVNPDSLKQVVEDAIMGLKSSVSLEEMKCYTAPSVDENDEELNALAARLNKYAQMTVTYKFGDMTKVLNGDEIHEWVHFSSDNLVTIDAEAVNAWVKQLASEYDTAYKSKIFKTTYGPVVTVTKGNYGWKINQTAEAAALTEIISQGENQEREPVYSQQAESHGENDFGNTYVEINLTAQHLYFYKNGELVTESDFVSGNLSKGYGTPSGIYPVTYKQRNATLKGQGYSTPVSYWMPFNGGVGMHDASWRSNFGGKIYKTNGSHGCINLPPNIAKTIYENISQGTPVICYTLDGTDSGKTTGAAAQPETTAVETSAGETTPVLPSETGVGETMPALPSETSTGETTPVLPSETTAAETQAVVTPAGQETTASPTPLGPQETTAAVVTPEQPSENVPGNNEAPSEGINGGPGVG